MKTILAVAVMWCCAATAWSQKVDFHALPDWKPGTEKKMRLVRSGYQIVAGNKVEDPTDSLDAVARVVERQGDLMRLSITQPNPIFTTAANNHNLNLFKARTGLEEVNLIYMVNTQTGAVEHFNAGEYLAVVIDSYDRVSQALAERNEEEFGAWEFTRDLTLMQYERPNVEVGLIHFLTGVYGKKIIKKEKLEENIQLRDPRIGIGTESLKAIRTTWNTKHKAKTEARLAQNVVYDMDDYRRVKTELMVGPMKAQGVSGENLTKMKTGIEKQLSDQNADITVKEAFLYDLESGWVRSAESEFKIIWTDQGSINEQVYSQKFKLLN